MVQVTLYLTSIHTRSHRDNTPHKGDVQSKRVTIEANYEGEFDPKQAAINLQPECSIKDEALSS